MNALIPMTELNQMAVALGKGNLFGKTAEQLLPLLLIASAEGKHPAIAAQEYDIIQGRPALNSRAALARFQSAGGTIQWTKRSDEECSAKFSHPQGGTVEVAWSFKRATTAGLTGKDNWKKFPCQMLSARVVAEGVRACYPAALSGFYLSEEVQDFDAPRHSDYKKPESITISPKPEPITVEAEIVKPVVEEVKVNPLKLEAEELLKALSATLEQEPEVILTRITKGKVTTWDLLLKQTDKVLNRIIDLLKTELADNYKEGELDL